MTPDPNMDDQATGKSNPRNNPNIFKIFQNVQYNVVQHKKYVKELIKLYKKIDQNFFRESFKNALHYLFTFGDTSASVDRVIQFVATFCTSLNDEEEFLMFIFEVIFECQCLSGQSVRYRASQLLAAVLSALGDDASLDDDLCDKLLASQMERLQDTRGAVRCRAALALQRLQNPLDSDDPVTRAYRFHMSCDPSSSVRRAIVMSIAKSTRNVPFVLERLCDVDEAVRRAAFLYISAINVTQLRVRQRIHTLKVGLNERTPRVRRVVEEIVIPSWLSIFQGNIIDLLKAIRLDNSQDAKDSQYVAGKLLESLFKRLPISELLEWLPTDKSLRLITAEKLNKETTWYWRHLAEHLQKIGDDETLETVLPDLVVLTGYIRAIVESPCPSQKEDPVGFSTRQYVLQELGSMLRVYDASDPAGRTALQALLQDTLTGDHGPLSAEVIRAFVTALELAIPDVGERIKCICQMVSTLRNPPEVEEEPVPFVPVDCTEIKLQRARLRVSLNVAMEAQEEAVKDENYALASECKAKVADIQKKLEELNLQTKIPQPQPLSTEKEKQVDSETMNKCLIILNSALDTPQLKTILPTLQLVYDDLEPEILQNPDILENALETVALFGMLDKNFLRDHKSFFFTHLLDTTNEAVVATVLKCIVDILCVHGARVFEDEAQDISKLKEKKINKHNTLDDIDFDESTMSLSSALSTVIELLLNVMNTDNPTFRLIIVDGLCRLIYLGHLESPAIISRLLLLWFNPATVDEDNLRQSIGIFFQTFPVSVDGAQEQIQKATLPTLRALANAPSSSPLAEIDQEAVVRFLVSLTRFNHELIDSQGSMAMTLVGYLMRKPTCSEVGLACRMLALLSPPRDARTTFDLIKMLRELNQKLPDKQSCRNLTRYLGALEASERASLNKMSTGTEGIIQAEDSIQTLGRTTASLTVPLAWSTHVIINDVVTEETEIDETSPTRISKISHVENSSEEQKSLPLSTDTEARESKEHSEDGSSGVSSVKKVKVTKEKKKTLSMKRKTDAKKTKQNKNSAKEDKKEHNEKGVKRSRSQRSIVDVDRAKKEAEEKSNKEIVQQSPPLDDFDASNVTVRKSTRGLQSSSSSDSNGSGKGKKGRKPQKKKGQQEIPRRSTRSSNGSSRSSESFTLDNSGDETELHTIVYDNDIQQEILNDSSQINTTSKANVVIPETPDGSEESESEPEVVTKGKHKK